MSGGRQASEKCGTLCSCSLRSTEPRKLVGWSRAGGGRHERRQNRKAGKSISTSWYISSCRYIEEGKKERNESKKERGIAIINSASMLCISLCMFRMCGEKDKLDNIGNASSSSFQQPAIYRRRRPRFIRGNGNLIHTSVDAFLIHRSRQLHICRVAERYKTQCRRPRRKKRAG